MLKVKVFYSKKKEDLKMCALVYDLGYRLIFLTFNLADIAEVLNISVGELREYPVGVYDIK